MDYESETKKELYQIDQQSHYCCSIFSLYPFHYEGIILIEENFYEPGT